MKLKRKLLFDVNCIEMRFIVFIKKFVVGRFSYSQMSNIVFNYIILEICLNQFGVAPLVSLFVQR